ncbi:hypothetical protein HYW42_01250 [Candidatus Daviesbacteria bacterium]|nr:hypothetical protein [Candidatus Daviesbacteria bacterium]
MVELIHKSPIQEFLCDPSFKVGEDPLDNDPLAAIANDRVTSFLDREIEWFREGLKQRPQESFGVDGISSFNLACIARAVDLYTETLEELYDIFI